MLTKIGIHNDVRKRAARSQSQSALTERLQGNVGEVLRNVGAM